VYWSTNSPAARGGKTARATQTTAARMCARDPAAIDEPSPATRRRYGNVGDGGGGSGGEAGRSSTFRRPGSEERGGGDEVVGLVRQVGNDSSCLFWAWNGWTRLAHGTFFRRVGVESCFRPVGEREGREWP
jgi:hypothetical protein